MAPVSRPQESVDSLPRADARDERGFFRRHAAKLLASTVITAGILYTVHKGGLKFVPEGGDFKAVKWWVLPLYLVVLVVMSYFRAVRWRFLLRSVADVSRRRILAVSWIGFAAILLMPFRLGEIVRPYMIREKGKVSLTSATSSIIAERIVDGLFLSIILAVALLFVPTLDPLPEMVAGLRNTPITMSRVRIAAFSVLGLFVVAFASIAIFYFARNFARKATMAIVGLVSKRLADKVAGIFEKFVDGLAFLGRGKDSWGFLVETAIYWGLNAFGMWLLAWGCGIVHADGSAITIGETCAVMGMVGVTILIPGPPGLLGLFQAGVFAGMTMYFPAHVVEGPGAAYVFILYAIQVTWTVVSASAFLLGDRKNLRALEESQGIVVAPEAEPS